MNRAERRQRPTPYELGGLDAARNVAALFHARDTRHTIAGRPLTRDELGEIERDIAELYATFGWGGPDARD